MAEQDTMEQAMTADVLSPPMTQRGEDVDLESVYDIPVEVSVILGKAAMPIDTLLKMGAGAVIELQRKVGEPVDVYVNGRIVARGEVVIVEDKIGITMTEIIKLEG